MNRFLIIISIFVLSTSEKCNNDTVSIVNLNFTRTSSYCGGAAPADFILRELATPRSFDGEMLYLYNSENMCIDSFKAIGDSTYKTALPNGEYAIKLVPKVQNIVGNTEEVENCLTLFKQRSLSQLSITNDTSITANLHFDCNPCYPPRP